MIESLRPTATVPFWARGGRLLAVVLLLAGCTVNSKAQNAGRPTSPSPASPKSCSTSLAAVRAHPSWPRQLPLPPGTTVVSCEERSGGRLVIDAVIPTRFRSVLTFLQTRFPAAGFPLGDGEVEPGDAESIFTGHGYYGRWSIRALEGQTLLSMFTVRA